MRSRGARHLHLSLIAAASLIAAVSGAVRAQATFSDDFERPDGPAGGWTTALGTWGIVDGHLTTVADGPTESWIWAGTPPLKAIGDMELRAVVEFGTRPPGDVGRHGGLMFFADGATSRGVAGGYTVDWIDRTTPPFNDYGFRFIRVDPVPGGVVQNVLVSGTPLIPQVPLEWVVQVEGDQIRLLADGELVFEVTDGTYRQGNLGVWAYNNGTNINIHEIQLTYSPVELEACFGESALTGTAPFAVDFDASCTQSLNGVSSYDWDFGDGEVGSDEKVSHTFQFGGSYMVTLTVKDSMGKTDAASATLSIFDAATSFSDDFSRADGPVDNWTVFQGQWNIAGEELTTATAGAEHWAWAGDPAFSFPANFTLRYTYRFNLVPDQDVGRHGGVMFCAAKPTWRYDGTNTGYTIDWIDRLGDHGIRLIRVDTGLRQTLLDRGAQNVLDPPQEWEIVVEGEIIRVFGDGTQYLETRDSRYRKGFFGAWAYANDQSIALDDVDMSSPSVSACFDVSPSLAEPVGTLLGFDAGCSSATGTPIDTHHWDFGDGGTAEGAPAQHAYSTVGTWTAKLTVRTQGGLSGETDRAVESFIPLTSFEDDFSRADGPPPGWTVAGGDWSIQGGVLHDRSPDPPEAWIFAGDPAVRVGGVSSIEFSVDFLNSRPADPFAVGRHGGVMFFARLAKQRFEANSGYSIDWIDRAGDHGYRISAFDEGVQRLLHPIVGDADPGKEWRIEIEGDTFRFLVDGTLKAEFVDATYRVGFFGFWAYWGDPLSGFVQLVDFDDLKIGAGGGPTGPTFHRGDADDNGQLEITDALRVLGYLFLGQEAPTCFDAADADNNDELEITDALRILGYLFLGQEPPSPPGPPTDPCGEDPLDTHLGCASYTQCASPALR